MAVTRQDFPALTGVRFVATSMVFLFHYANLLFPAAGAQWGYFFLRQLNCGVTIFFVLSGFLITYCYYTYLTSGQPLRVYFLKRIARIFPLYWAVLLTYFGLKALQNDQFPDVQTLLLNLTLLHGFSARYFFSGLTQSWSLTVEETFYLYAPVCFLLIRFRRFLWAQVVLLLGAGVFFVWLASLFPAAEFWGDFEYLFSGTFFGRCFEFFAGIALALQLQKQLKRRSGVAVTLIGTLLFTAFLLLLACLAYQGRQPGYNFSLAGVAVLNFLLPASVAVFFYGLLVEETVVKKLLSSKLLVLLGKSSYAFYLLHIGMIAEVLFFHVTRNLFFLYVLLQLLSVLTYKLFEKPVYFFLLHTFQISAKNRSIVQKQTCGAANVKPADRTDKL